MPLHNYRIFGKKIKTIKQLIMSIYSVTKNIARKPKFILRYLKDQAKFDICPEIYLLKIKIISERTLNILI